MEAKTLIENLIAAIDDALAGRVDDAKETAQLARMVLPNLAAAAPAAPAAPVGSWVVEDEDNGHIIGGFATQQDADQWAQTALDPQGFAWASREALDIAAYSGFQPRTAQHPAAQGPPQPPQGVPALCSCGASNDYNGNCTDPNCPDGNYVAPLGPPVTGPIPAQSFDEVMADVHEAANRHRPGSVISNKPPGSLYKSS